MAFATVPTVAPGDAWSAAQHNTYIRDNFAALFVGLAAGDIDYYSAVNAKSRLAKPTLASDLTNNNAGTVAWLDKTLHPGVLQTKGMVDFTSSDQNISGTWTDITNATLTLTLKAGATYTIVVHAMVRAYQNAGRVCYIRAMVGGVADAGSNNGNGGEARTEINPYVYYKTGQASGSCVVKMQGQKDTDAMIVQGGRIVALAYVE